MVRVALRIPGHNLVATQASRAGIMAASANVAATFARGLLPRSAMEQAMATGVCTAAMYQAATTGQAAAETLALLSTGSRGMRGREPDLVPTLVADLTFAAIGIAAGQLMPPDPDESLGTSITRFAAETLMLGGTAGAVVTVVDDGLRRLLPGRHMTNRPLLADVAIGGSIAGLTVLFRHRQAREYGLVDPTRRTIKKASAVAKAKAVGGGIGAGIAMTLLASGEQLVAHSVKKAFDEKVPGLDIGSPLVGHTVALGILSLGGMVGFSVVKRRIEVRGDVVEPAYPEAPSSSFVSAGPKSIMKFDEIGKEGRRFVLMALTAAEIEGVMGESIANPIRIIGGFEAAKTTGELARLTFDEMERLGAFDRKIICVASPTGVGYVSYTFAESLEYLTLGDCAIIVPQYALVPSALAIFDTHDGVNLQRAVLGLARDKIASLPEHRRPKLVQFGESLGAQVALDIAYPHGAAAFDQLGLDAGLYLGVPFRSTTWNSWRNAQQLFDPQRSLALAAKPADLMHDPERRGEPFRHVMIVHDDDPVNKFTYRLIVKQPWWMGPPTTRPPKVPRETVWRPVTTFVLTLVDLMNGMEFKPGEFHRRGHDYRIDSREATMEAFSLDCTVMQAEAIEAALRQREMDWAARRLVARKFDNARKSIQRTLTSWGVKAPPEALDQLAVFDQLPVDPTLPDAR